MKTLQCLGLTRLTSDDPEKIAAFLQATACDGLLIKGYSQNGYINSWKGDLQFIHNALKEEDGYKIHECYPHSTGSAVWNFRVSTIGSVDMPDFDELEKRVMITCDNGEGGLAVINLLNADVLPGWGINEIITAQVVAMPEEIHYYETDEAYAAAITLSIAGEPLLLDDGMVFPLAYLMNHSTECLDPGQAPIENTLSDGLVWIKETVKGVRSGKCKLNPDGEEFPLFLQVLIDTRFGELVLVHGFDQVSDEEYKLIRIGSKVFGCFTLYGDCAIYEYENGIVLDEEHDLRLLKNVIDGSSGFSRLRGVLTDQSVYVSDHSGGKAFTGTDDIISRFHTIRNAMDEEKIRNFTYIATITQVDDASLPYGVGKRCMVIAENDPDKLISVVFLDLDENGKIARLSVGADHRYHFVLDHEPKPGNFGLPDVIEPKA